MDVVLNGNNNNMRLFLIGAAIFCSSVYTHAQLYISADAGLYHMVERAEIKTNDLNELNFHSSSKPYRYIDVSNLAVKHADLTRNDSFNLVNFKNQSFFMNPEFGARAQGFLSYFYKQNAALYSVQLNDFVLMKFIICTCDTLICFPITRFR